MDKRLSRQSHKLKIGGSNPSPAISLSLHFLHNVCRPGHTGKGCIATRVAPFLVSMFVYGRVSRLLANQENILYPTISNPLEHMRSRFAGSLKPAGGGAGEILRPRRPGPLGS